MAIFGGGTYAALLRRAALPSPPARAVRLVFATAATLALLSAIVWFCLIAGQMSGSGLVEFRPLRPAAPSNWRHRTRVLGKSFSAVSPAWPRSGGCSRWGQGPADQHPVVGRNSLLTSLGPISHAAATGGGGAIAGAANDAAHWLSAGFWLGGLLVLIMFVRLKWADPASLLGALRLFSVWGTPLVAALVITGLINVISILPVSEMSPRNAYFDLLLVKVGLASAMIGLAAMNRWHFAPALRAARDNATRHLAISVGVEIVLGFTVVAVAAWLGLTSPH